MENIPIGWISIAALFLGSLAMLILRGKSLFTRDLTKTVSKINVQDLLMMMAFILGFSAVISLFGLLMRIGTHSSGEANDIFSLYYANFSGLLYVILLGPILEEIIFRGAILRSLEPFGKNFAIVVSSLLFGLYHMSLFQGIFAFFIGLIFGYCTVRFSIKWAMLLHIANNAYAMAMSIFQPNLFIELGIYLGILLLCLLLRTPAYRKFRQQLVVGKPTELHFATGVPLVINPYWLRDLNYLYYVRHAITLKAKPYHLAFSSAWLIVLLSLLSLSTLVLTFVS
jgi:membrane protease YdiL (CAAX protease family)